MLATVKPYLVWIVLVGSVFMLSCFALTLKWVLEFNRKFMEEYMTYKFEKDQLEQPQPDQEDLTDSAKARANQERSRKSSMNRLNTQESALITRN